MKFNQPLISHSSNGGAATPPSTPSTAHAPGKVDIPGKEGRVQFLTIPQIADRWQVSDRTVWRLISEGRLGSVMIGKCRRVAEAVVRTFEYENRATAA